MALSTQGCDRQDQNPQDIAFLREQLSEDFQFTKTRKAVAECILNAAVYGTAVGELVLEEVKQLTRLIIEESDRICKLVDEMDAFTDVSKQVILQSSIAMENFVYHFEFQSLLGV